MSNASRLRFSLISLKLRKCGQSTSHVAVFCQLSATSGSWDIFWPELEAHTGRGLLRNGLIARYLFSEWQRFSPSSLLVSGYIFVMHALRVRQKLELQFCSKYPILFLTLKEVTTERSGHQGKHGTLMDDHLGELRLAMPGPPRKLQDVIAREGVPRAVDAHHCVLRSCGVVVSNEGVSWMDDNAWYAAEKIRRPFTRVHGLPPSHHNSQCDGAGPRTGSMSPYQGFRVSNE
jgi:hypothetical protein